MKSSRNARSASRVSLAPDPLPPTSSWAAPPVGGWNLVSLLLVDGIGESLPKERIRERLNGALRPYGEFLVDLLVISLAMFVATKASMAFAPVSLGEIQFAFLTVPVVGSLLAARGVYRRDPSIMYLRETRLALEAVLIFALIVFGLLFGIKAVHVSRTFVFCAVAILGVSVVMSRAIVFRMYAQLHRRGLYVKQCLIYGAGSAGQQLARKLFFQPNLGLRPVGFIDDDPRLAGKTFAIQPRPAATLRVVGNASTLTEAIKQHSPDEVIMCMPSATTEEIAAAIGSCKQSGIPFRIVPPMLGVHVDWLNVETVGGFPVYSIRSPQRPLYYGFWQRCFDVVTAMIGLVLAAPVMAAIAIAVRLTSKGPAIFKQDRIGLHGEPFTIHKFRTMHQSAEIHALKPSSSEDSRITSVGRFLRRTSLDELPQLWNVLVGEMSIVGPRPEMPFLVAQYDATQKQRLKVKPGITGVWQLSADRNVPIHENIEYDLYYMNHQSVLLDLIIVIQTAFFAIGGI